MDKSQKIVSVILSCAPFSLLSTHDDLVYRTQISDYLTYLRAKLQ